MSNCNVMDLDNLLQQALSISSNFEDCDPTKPPTTGEQYLYRVMQETSQCPDVVTADFDRQKFNSNQTFHVPDLGGCVSAPTALLPSLEWQQKEIANFSKMRERVAELRKSIPIPTESNTPAITDESAWRRYFQNDFPRLTSVLCLSQPHVDVLLEYHASWLQESEPGSDINSVGVWIYSLLICLETPLLPETCSTLRQIARKCSQLRAELTPEKQTLHFSQPMNLIICLVARYFNQIDLADN